MQGHACKVGAAGERSVDADLWLGDVVRQSADGKGCGDEGLGELDERKWCDNDKQD